MDGLVMVGTPLRFGLPEVQEKWARPEPEGFWR